MTKPRAVNCQSRCLYGMCVCVGGWVGAEVGGWVEGGGGSFSVSTQPQRVILSIRPRGADFNGVVLFEADLQGTLCLSTLV